MEGRRLRLAVTRSLEWAQSARAWRRRPARTARRPSIEEPPGSTIAANEHGVYVIPLSGLRRPVSQRILAGHVWEPLTLDRLRRAATRGDVVHAGTYFGDFLPALAAAAAARDHLIWGFEPNPESWASAVGTVELNGLTNVKLANQALSEAPGELALVTRDRKGRALGGRSHLSAPRASTSGTMVEVVRLDDVIDPGRHVAAIHLDVEGHEDSALRGAQKLIERDRPLLVLEDGAASRAAVRELAQQGYRLIETVERNLVLAV